MRVLIFWTVVLSTLWVVIDASRLGVRRGVRGGGLADMGVFGWLMCCLLFWVVGFPAYVLARPRYVAMRAAHPFGPLPFPDAHGQVGGYAPVVAPPAPISIPAQIHDLASLHASGVLSDEEFAAKKAELLGRM